MQQEDILIQKILVGSLVQLEPLTINHYEHLRAAANDPRIWAYMPARAEGSFYDAWFQDCLMKHLEGAQLSYVIKRKQDNELIGSCAYYDIDLQHKKLEVGYGWLNPSVWGIGYNLEPLSLLFQNAFETWGINRIQIATDPRNIKSYNALKKLGATQEGVLRQHMIHHNGHMTDTVLFSLLAEEWACVKTMLDKRLSNVLKRNLDAHS